MNRDVCAHGTPVEQDCERCEGVLGSLDGLDEIAVRQHAWVGDMGWHNKTPLESLALIASEIGEAVDECRGDTPTAAFGEELADIVLRSLDLAEDEGFRLDAAAARFRAVPMDPASRVSEPVVALAYLMPILGAAMNACRGEETTPVLGEKLAELVARVEELADIHGIDLRERIAKKMAINATRGARGRLK